MELLGQRKREQAEQRLQAGDFWQGWHTPQEQKTALVFANVDGSKFCPQTVYNHYKKLATQIGTPDSWAHDLRNTYVVLSLQNGDGIKTVQENQGNVAYSFFPLSHPPSSHM